MDDNLEPSAIASEIMLVLPSLVNRIIMDPDYVRDSEFDDVIKCLHLKRKLGPQKFFLGFMKSIAAHNSMENINIAVSDVFNRNSTMHMIAKSVIMHQFEKMKSDVNYLSSV